MAFLFFSVAALIALASRWLPHPDNFSAMYGLLFLCGYLLPKNKLVLPLGLSILMISDFLIGLYPGVEWVYLGYLMIFALGWLGASGVVGSLKSLFVKVGALNLFAGLAFFFVSNFGVWFATGLYDKTWAGFVQCYLMALPFLHMTLISQVVIGVAFVGAYHLVVSQLASVAVVDEKN